MRYLAGLCWLILIAILTWLVVSVLVIGFMKAIPLAEMWLDWLKSFK